MSENPKQGKQDDGEGTPLQRRRRGLVSPTGDEPAKSDPQAVSQSVTDQGVTEPPPAPETHPDVAVDEATGSEPRIQQRRMSTLIPVGRADAGDGEDRILPIAEPKTSAEAEAGPAHAPASGESPEKPTETVSPGQRAIRLILLFLLIIVMVGFLLILLMEEQRVQQIAPGSDVPEFNYLAPDPDGDAAGAELLEMVQAGRYDEVASFCDRVIERRPVNRIMLKALLLAESAKDVKLAMEKLDSLPTIDGGENHAALPVEEKLARIGPRVKQLQILSSYRKDWGNELVALPEMADIYAKSGREIMEAASRIANWENAQSALNRAMSEIAKSAPDFAMVHADLQIASRLIPENKIENINMNVERLQNGHSLLAKQDMHGAYTQLTAIDADGGRADSRYVEERIGAAISLKSKNLLQQFSNWQQLWNQGEACAALYNQGDVAGAMGMLEDALETAASDASIPVQSLHRQLESRLDHYRRVNGVITAARRSNGDGEFENRIRLWQNVFAAVSETEDPAQFAEAVDALETLRREIAAEIAQKGEAAAELWSGYSAPNTVARSPTSPREPFREEAEKLARASKMADGILDLYNLAPRWFTDELSERYMRLVREIHSEQSDQARKLWNLGRVYRERGRIEWFRECLERILFLGSSVNNPFYDDARRLLQEENEEGANNG